MNGRALLSFIACLLLCIGASARAQSPPIAAELEVRGRYIILEYWTRSMVLTYHVGTPLSQEQFEAFFPETSGNGVRQECGIRSLAGVRVDFAIPIEWGEGYIVTHSASERVTNPYVAPPSLVELVARQVETATVDYIVFQDHGMEESTAFSGEFRHSKDLELEALRFRGPPVAWTATIEFEAYCDYRAEGTGEWLSTMTTSDLGGTPLLLTQEDEDIDRYGTPADAMSWTAVKARY